MAAFLSILPFFAIFLYFKKFNTFIFLHAVFLFLLLLIKDMVKNFVNLKGDLAQGNQSLPVKYGEGKAQIILLIISVLLLIPVYLLKRFEILGDMKYYFIIFILIYFPGLFYFLRSRTVKQYRIFYNLLKFLIILGVFSVALVRRPWPKP